MKTRAWCRWLTSALARAGEVLEVELERRLDGQRSGDLARRVALQMQRARLVLRLLEVENGDAVGVGEVVGDAVDLLDHIGAAADIVPRRPGARRRQALPCGPSAGGSR